MMFEIPDDESLWDGLPNSQTNFELNDDFVFPSNNDQSVKKCSANSPRRTNSNTNRCKKGPPMSLESEIPKSLLPSKTTVYSQFINNKNITPVYEASQSLVKKFGGLTKIPAIISNENALSKADCADLYLDSDDEFDDLIAGCDLINSEEKNLLQPNPQNKSESSIFRNNSGKTVESSVDTKSCDDSAEKVKRCSLKGASKYSERSRKFPGPAGILPLLGSGDGAELTDDPVNLEGHPSGCSPPPQQPFSLVSQSDDIFSGDPWDCLIADLGTDARELFEQFSVAGFLYKASMKHLPNGKVPLLFVVVKSLELQGDDAHATLADKTGDVRASIHRDVLCDTAIALTVGTVLVLRQTGVISPTSSRHYLNVTSSNVINSYAPTNIPNVKKLDISRLNEDVRRIVNNWQVYKDSLALLGLDKFTENSTFFSNNSRMEKNDLVECAQSETDRSHVYHGNERVENLTCSSQAEDGRGKGVRDSFGSNSFAERLSMPSPNINHRVQLSRNRAFSRTDEPIKPMCPSAMEKPSSKVMSPAITYYNEAASVSLCGMNGLSNNQRLNHPETSIRGAAKTLSLNNSRNCPTSLFGVDCNSPIAKKHRKESINGSSTSNDQIRNSVNLATPPNNGIFDQKKGFSNATGLSFLNAAARNESCSASGMSPNAQSIAKTQRTSANSKWSFKSRNPQLLMPSCNEPHQWSKENDEFCFSPPDFKFSRATKEISKPQETKESSKNNAGLWNKTQSSFYEDLFKDDFQDVF